MKFVVLVLSGILIQNLHAQVNLQTGGAQYSIPLFSFSDAKSGLATDVQLNYSSGNGLLVDDIPSNTGQNWSLIAGGSIVRKQNGEPDDQNSTSSFPVIPNGNVRGFNNNIAVYDDNYQSFSWSGDPYSRDYINNYFPNGYMYSEFPLDMTDNYPLEHLAPRELAFLPRFRSNMDKRYKLSRRALTDRQQDVFMYNFNGIIGEFVIGKDGNPLLTNDSKIIIEKTTADLTNSTPYNIRTRINFFKITDINGLIYKFSVYELEEVTKFQESASEGSNSFKKITQSGIPIAYPNGKYTIQKWLLSEILNPITDEKIIFEYEDYNIDIVSEIGRSYQYTEGQTVESVGISEQRAIGKLKRLKNILLPDGHKVEFLYSIKDRIDLPGDYPLTTVKISYDNETISTYKLDYGYFFKKQIREYNETFTNSDKRFARLCLKSLQKTGAKVAQPAYKFEYYTGSESSDLKEIVPPLHCVAQDHWGFYNKSSIVDIEEGNPSKEVLKDLMLNNSTYRQPSTNTARLGLLKTVVTPFGGKLTFEYEQNDSKDSDNPSQTKVAGGVRVFKTTVFDGGSSSDIVTTYSYKLSDGSTSGWGYETPTYVNRREIKVWNAGNLDGYTHGGVLVHDITATIAKIVVKKAVEVAIKTAFKAIAAKAAIVTAPQPAVAAAIIVVSGLIERLCVLFNPNDYVWSNVYNFQPFQSQNPIGVNYSRVEIKNTSLAAGTGKIVEEFSAPLNVRAEIPAFAMPYSARKRFPGWKYGLPVKTSVFNDAGTLIKEVINTYNIVANTVINDNHKSSKVEVVRPESADCWAATYNLPITDFSWEFYYPITGRAELANAIVKNYSQSGTLSQTQISNTYNSDYLLSSTTTTRSNGDQIVTKNYYTNDYDNLTTAIEDMKTYNMIDVPISVETWLTNPNITGYEDGLLNATINEFSKLTDGQIKLKKVYKLESNAPVAKTTIGEQTSSALVRNSTYLKEELVVDYNSMGIPVQTSNSAGEVSTNIFDYNNRLVIASVVNASISNTAYTSFEADGKGNWDFDNSSVNVSNIESVSGKRSFKLHNGSVSNSITKNNLDATKTYLVSYWAKSGSVLVNGSSSTSIYSVQGWNLYIHQFSGVTSISISGTALIDEVRLHPKTALMKTITYQPGIGKTSECDENNRISYFEYDDFGRLRIIRDENKNIVKMYEYNFKR